MGGKDAIVVDENIDTDLAAEAIVTSAFGFRTKCSACSRAIVHKDVHDEVLKSSSTYKRTHLGNTENNTFMGPVINQKQFDKIKNYIEIGKDEGQLEQGGALMIQQVTSLNQLSSQVLNLLTVSCKKKSSDQLLDLLK